MSRRVIFFFTLVVIFVSVASCQKKCNGKRIHFGFLAGKKGDQFKVYIDDKIRSERTLREDQIARFEDPRFRMFSLCTSADSLFTRISVNSMDTTFFIHTKDIKECYVGKDFNGHIIVIFNYERGGFRGYSDYG